MTLSPKLMMAISAGVLIWTAAPIWGDERSHPTAEDILDRYVQATGGKDAYEKLHTQLIKGVIEVPASQMKMPFTSYAAEPNKLKVVTELPNMGTSTQATDGQHAWVIDPRMGTRLLEGAEKDSVINGAYFHEHSNWRNMYKDVKYVAKENIDGKECYKLEVKFVGQPQVQYFEVESGLLVQVESQHEQMGMSVPITNKLEDYKEASGILVPHTVRQSMSFGGMKQEVLIKMNTIEYNVKLPDGVFEIPEELRTHPSNQGDTEP